jgi:hypothetical protein
LLAVTVTAGQSVSAGGGLLHVPQHDLVGCLQVLLQERRLAVARDLADAALLVRELEGFRMKPPLQTTSLRCTRKGERQRELFG